MDEQLLKDAIQVLRECIEIFGGIEQCRSQQWVIEQARQIVARAEAK